MSTHWHIQCVTCNEKHRFDNCRNAEMLAVLCKNATAIAGMADLINHCDVDIDISTMSGNINPAWFKAHLGHMLVPIDEYGHLMTECGESFKVSCAACDRHTWERCALDHGHIGDHAVRSGG